MVEGKNLRKQTSRRDNSCLLLTVAILALCSFEQDTNAQETVETYVLSSEQKGQTTFRVFPNLIGVVPGDNVSFEEAREKVESSGFEVVRASREAQMIITRTLEPAASFIDLRAQAERLRTANAEAVRWAGPLVAAGDAEDPETIDFRQLRIPTDVVILKTKEGVTEDVVSELAERFRLRLLQRNPVDERVYYFEQLGDPSEFNVFTSSQALLQADIAEYALPNFLFFVETRHPVVNDEFFGEQWTLRNDGQHGGLADADIDADLAWRDFGFGSPKTLIAVIDSGFEMEHPDLRTNFVADANELPLNNIDDDNNDYVDDHSGWDFTSECWHTPFTGCGDHDPTSPNTLESRHGTMTSGAAAAAGDNLLGVSGSCPNCALLPLRVRTGQSSATEQSLAFAYAQMAGADIITNSWGYQLDAATVEVENAINNAVAAGVTVFFAMSSTGENGYRNDCATDDISSLDSVIAVSASNNVDTRTPSGYGDCLAVLAPTDNEDAGGGTLWPVSTDLIGAAGFNDDDPVSACVSPELGALSYTYCANGTSYATPLIAGVSGLMESVDNALTPERHRQILQDTADKIEPSIAAYDPNTGFSDPVDRPMPLQNGAMGHPAGSTHGYGRANAWEAVKLVAPVEHGGRGEIDLFVRDNDLDWGNTAQPSNLSLNNPREHVAADRSISIKIDAPPFAPEPPPTNAPTFASFPDEEPMAGVTNRVYLLVRNRGRLAATNVTARLAAGDPADPPPPDVWMTSPSGAPGTANSWSVVAIDTVPSVRYSGASIAMDSADGAEVASFDFTAPALDTSGGADHDLALLAVVDSIDDCLSDNAYDTEDGCVLVDLPADATADQLSSNYNNVTLRHVSLQDP